MFTPTNPSSFNTILHGIDNKITPAMNVDLTKGFTVDKVKKALK